MTLLSPDPKETTVHLTAVSSAITPIDHYFRKVQLIEDSVRDPSSTSGLEIGLSSVNPALATAVSAAKANSFKWVFQNGGAGVRDLIWLSLVNGYAYTARKFDQTAGAVEELLEKIAESGATAEQIDLARSKIAELSKVVHTSGDALAATQADYASFSQNALDDIEAITGTDGPLRAILDDYGKFIMACMAGAGAFVLEAQKSLCDEVWKDLYKLQQELAGSLDAAKAVGPALVQLSTQWMILAKSTENVSTKLADASASGLKDVLTKLDIGTARYEWAELAKIAGAMADAMGETFDWEPEKG